MVTSITGSGTMPTGLAPNFEQALEKVQDDVDFYAMLSALGQQVTDASGNRLTRYREAPELLTQADEGKPSQMSR